jgi:ribosomal protein S18 acetylase RimI-like enzyme
MSSKLASLMPRIRHRYVLNLAGLTPGEASAPPGIVIRNPSTRDAEGIATLLLDAHRGGLDDEGEDFDAALRVVQDAFCEEPLPAASWLALDGERVVSVLMMRRWKERPLVVTIATHPSYARRGLAATLLERTLASLHASGEAELVAFITEGNTPSEALFTGRGFARIVREANAVPTTRS